MVSISFLCVCVALIENVCKKVEKMCKYGFGGGFWGKGDGNKHKACEWAGVPLFISIIWMALCELNEDAFMMETVCESTHTSVF